ncbi:MAG: hypothetical protein NVS4B3_06390 [Gemmatimonadaceae bacterium]
MRLLAEVVAVAGWLGAAVCVAGVVAPAAFAVSPTRAVAGDLVGRTLAAVFVSGAVVGVVIAMIEARAPHRTPIRLAAGAVLALSCVFAHWVVAPQIERVRRGAGGATAALLPGDARRATFKRLHALSVGALALSVVAAATVLVSAAVDARVALLEGGRSPTRG